MQGPAPPRPIDPSPPGSPERLRLRAAAFAPAGSARGRGGPGRAAGGSRSRSRSRRRRVPLGGRHARELFTSAGRAFPRGRDRAGGRGSVPVGPLPGDTLARGPPRDGARACEETPRYRGLRGRRGGSGGCGAARDQAEAGARSVPVARGVFNMQCVSLLPSYPAG